MLRKLAALGVFLIIASHGLSSGTAVRASYDFNMDWRLLAGDVPWAEGATFDVSSWKAVNLPYAWNQDDAFRLSIYDLPTGTAWYRKTFRLPPGSEGKKILLEFEGIRHAGEFYINGHWIGRHENGVMAFGFDITPYVRLGADNSIAVRTDNSWFYREKATDTPFQWNDRNFYVNYGGINKNVNLHVTDRLYQTLPLYSNLETTGVYVYARDFDLAGKAATVTVESEVRNEHEAPREFLFAVEVRDMEGKVVASFDGGRHRLEPGETRVVAASQRIQNLEFWSWGYGYLYDVTSSLVVAGAAVDAVTTRTGFRQTEFSNGMVKLNGRAIHLKGYAQRTTNEWPGVGISVPPWISDLSNRMMVESHANLVRWMHVTPSKQDVESCDRVGLLQAMPPGDSERDSEGRRWDLRVELMRDAIIYNRNNPSIIFYEAGNKGVSEEHMAEMNGLRDRYDPHGGRASGSREMLDSKVAEWGGEMLYVNKSARIPFWATEYSRDEGLRKYWDEFSPPYHRDGDGPPHRGQPAPTYNRNQDSHAVENVRRWYDYWLERPGTGRRVNAGGVNIIFSDTNTHFRGAENYRRSGEVDAMRIPKDGFFAHRVMWNGWVDVEEHGAHIIGHWNYAAGVRKPIYVVSSADEVELFLNGRSLGRGRQSSRFLHTFGPVEWEPGELRAVGYNAASRKVCEDARVTAGAPAAIRLRSMTNPGGFLANGSDLALIEVEVVDADGRRCPTALNAIRFEVDGPAEWRGGIAQGPDNHIGNLNLPVEGGVNRAFVRSTRQAGSVTVRAVAEGLAPASLRLETVPVEAGHGLAQGMRRDAGLPSNLSRGATPKGDGFTPTRHPVRIVLATAGANSNRAARAYDDDETTSWTNDDRISTAWIRFELEKAAKVNQITAKMGRFRDRSYPVRILVDERVVFTGMTPRGLGYITLPFEPTEGRTVTLDLRGRTNDEDAFASIVEVLGHREITDDDRRGGTLEIIEIEIYE
jgi:beta-galactosidase